MRVHRLLSSLSVFVLKLSCKLTETTERTARHDHPVIADRTLDVVSLTHTGPEGDEGAWQIREATAFSCLLRDTAGKDTGHEGGTETNAHVGTAVT